MIVLVEHCKASGNAGDGIIAVNNCELKDNRSTGNGTGLHLTGTNTIVASNTVKTNTDNYNLRPGQSARSLTQPGAGVH
jgi:parallel beta-helix repeat protein